VGMPKNSHGHAENLMPFKEKISFDDVLLEPKYSEIRSRAEVDLSVKLCKGFKFGIPFIPANMASIVSKQMILRVIEFDGLTIMHRFGSLEEQLKLVSELKTAWGDVILDYVGVSVGVRKQDYDNLKVFSEVGVKIFCVDIAHLDSVQGLEMVGYIAVNYPKALLIAGNIATAEAARRAWRAGADVVKVGIGSGSICSTRIEAAAGVPQLSAIMEVADSRNKLEFELGRPLFLISDGSAREAGDCVKSLCFADMVMLGSYFAGALETPGEVIEINGQKLKPYHGSSTHKDSRVEGVKAVVHSKGSVLSLMTKLIEGVQSGCSYQNAKTLRKLRESPTFIRITGAGLTESRIHDVIVPLHY
jgi:IMP dehydrogenase